jgi:transposase
MKKTQRKIDLSGTEIEELSQRLQDKSLCDNDYETLMGMLEVLVTLNEVVRQKDISIKRLLKRIFGIKTEKRKKLFDNEASPEDPSSPAADGDNDGENRQTEDKVPSEGSHASEGKNDPEDTVNGEENPKVQSKNSHGRNGVDKFPGAERKQIEHVDLKAGDKCPLQCPNGRLYPLKPVLTLCFSGNAPVGGTILERERLRCNACGAVFTAEVDDGTITGSRHYDASAKAAISVYKYGFGMPFYRISGLQELVGIPLAPSTLWEKAEALADTILPVYQAMVRQAAQAKIFHNDDTTMPVLSFIKENELKTDKERTGMFTTGIVAILENDTTIALFFTGRNHAGENLDDLQELRDPEKRIPIQMCDALSRNTSELFSRYVAHCLSHGRRNFVDIIPAFPDECKMVIDTFALVYKNDDIAKKKALSDEQRLEYHKEHSGPAMQTLHDWMTEQIDEKLVEPNSILGKAISYMLKYWPALTLFLTIAGAPLDNNICERILKRVLLNRKNAMFYKNQVGAWIGDLFMSIIHTCYLAKINPMDYMIKLQEYDSMMRQDPEKWMPWNYQETIAQIESQTIVV